MKHPIATTVVTMLVLAAGGATWLHLDAGSSAQLPGAVRPEGNESAGSREVKTWYTCGMHPEVVEDHPGDCPKCGMKLQPMAADRALAMGLIEPDQEPSAAGERKILYWKSSMTPGEIYQEAGKDAMGMDLVPVYADEISAAGAIRIDPVTEQNMGIRVDKVTRGPLRKTIRNVGYVEYDETTLTVVTTKVDGWVEELYVDKTGDQVHEGDPLFELYSPELFSAQQEYLAALRNRQNRGVSSIPRSQFDSDALIRDARTRLEFFDISDEQIRLLERDRKISKTLTIRAPFTGIVTHKNVVEGQRVKAGTDIFRIADLSTVWVLAKVFENDLPYVEPGQEALMTLSYVPGKAFRGRVTYVYPYLDDRAREVSVRMEFHNPGYELKPGMYANVTLTRELAKQATLVPDIAVINTGLRAVAFVEAAPGRFEPRELKIGPRAENNRIQILSGLAPGETVVVSGQFLLDSESNLREAALKFMKPGKVDASTPVATATAQASPAGPDAPPAATAPGNAYYVCPMPEHVDVLHENPGKCPICGMALVPSLAGTAPNNVPYVCPMPEHADVQQEKPGKCPICGMALVPSPAATGPSNVSYVCPMPEHADVQQENPGKCPICGMTLIPSPAEPPASRGVKESANDHSH